MNRKILLRAAAALIAASCLVCSVSAQGSGGGIDAKLGFVNSLEVLQGCAEGKLKIAEIDVFANDREQELQTISQELNTLRTNLQSQVSTLNPATAEEMQSAIQSKERQLRRLTEDAEADLEARRADLFSEMGEKIRTVISEYADANSFDVIFLESPALPYHSESLNVTQAIIKAYDAKYPVN